MKRYLVLLCGIFLFSISLSQDFDSTKIVVQKLAFNTFLSEISCDFNNGNLIYFQNKPAHKANSPFYDLYRLDAYYLDEDNGNNSKISLTEQIAVNTKYHEGPCHIDEVNKRIYITVNILDKKEMRAERRQKVLNANRLKLIEADYKDGVITNMKEFPFNDPLINLGHATYSHLTKRLYFAATLSGSFGKSDIFYCEKQNEESWSKPIHLLNNINTSGDELFPQIKNGYLFFSSNAQKNQKGNDLDIFYIKESDIAIGSHASQLKQLSSDKDDFAICFTDDKDKFEGYFTSNRNNKFASDDDIYYFSMEGEEVSKKYDLTVTIKENGNALSTGVVTLFNQFGDTLQNSSIIGKSKTVKFKGLVKGNQYNLGLLEKYPKLKFDLPINKYEPFVEETVLINAPKLKNDTVFIEKPTLLKLDSNSTSTRDSSILAVSMVGKDSIKIETEKTKSDVKLLSAKDSLELFSFDNKITYESIYFGFDSYVVDKIAREKLNALVIYFNETNPKHVLLKAYTDSRGSNSYNEKLAVKRALACKKYLISKGISETQIKYVGFGETNLSNDCGDGVKCPESIHKMNRRIDFAFIK